MSIRRFVTIVLAGSALLVSVTLLLNGLVDPYARYGTNLINPLVEQPRRDKYLLLHDLAPPPDILILGSSRAMTLRPALIEALTGKTAFNAGVSRAMPLDYYIFSHYALAGLSQPPEQIILCIDLQALHPTITWNNPNWLADSPLRAYAKDASPTFSLEGILTSLTSGRQAADSVQAIWRNLTDESLGWPLYDRQGMIIDYGGGVPARETFGDYTFWESFDSIPPERFAEIADVFALVDEHGIALTVVLLPYAGDALTIMRRIEHFNRQQAALVDFLRAQQAVYGFTLHDWTDPAAFGGDPAGFGDYYHMTQTNADRVIEAIFAAQMPED